MTDVVHYVPEPEGQRDLLATTRVYWSPSLCFDLLRLLTFKSLLKLSRHKVLMTLTFDLQILNSLWSK